MQVVVDVTCLYIDFGGHDLSGFGDTTYFQKWPNFPSDYELYIIHGHQKI